MNVKNFIVKCFNHIKKMLSIYYYRLKYIHIKDKIRIENIASIEETIDYIVDKNVSVSRFGDGEFKWLLGVSQESFEIQSNALSEKLADVIRSNSPNHIVCISPALNNLDYCSKSSAAYWKSTLGKCGEKLLDFLDKNRKYYNANITRFYLNDVNRDKVKERFIKLRKIWNNRNLLIIEGQYSRLGVGNDLFSNAGTIRRIIAPSRNAFSIYDNIYDTAIEEYKKNDLILIALGPTATILAYDLSKKGIQAIDIGHIDIEYEWYIKGADSKIAISGKAVNEASVDLSAEKIPDSVYNLYQSQIIKTLKIGGGQLVNNKSKSYIHLSFDDVVYCFMDLAKNIDKYDTIFDCDFFRKLMELHIKYDAKFSLYCFNISKYVDVIGAKFASDFVNSNHWLKFGFHDYDGKKNMQVYNKFIEDIFKLGMDSSSIDRIPRLDRFEGKLKDIIEMRDARYGIVGLLTADDSRKSYYLTESQNNYIYVNGKLFDSNNGLMLYASNMRLDWFYRDFSTPYAYKVPKKSNPYEELIYRIHESNRKLDDNSPLVVFTHEWRIFNKNFKISHSIKYVEDVCKFAMEFEIPFDYPMLR